MGFTIETGVPVLTVFLQGLLSFFSPCVLPLVPLYIGYLASGTKTTLDDGTILYKQSKVIFNTLFFVLGISFAFFLLGLGFTAAGKFFSSNRLVFARIGGMIIVLFGLFQLGLFGSKTLTKEHRLPFNINIEKMNPLLALIIGFTFSFAWTPCVGPALTSVLLMASSAKSAATGFLLIGVYTLGFIIPFLAVGLFTSTVLDFFKKHQNVVRYSVKIGGILMIIMGVMMITGWMNGLAGYLSKITSPNPPASQTSTPSPTPTQAAPNETVPPTETAANDGNNNQQRNIANDFTLYDQYGKEHKLSDYKGKVIFMNFWATWCGYCVDEMPDIQALYEKYGKNEKDVVILGMANPKSKENPNNTDVSKEEISSFLEEREFTYPTLMDSTGEIFQEYGISSFPTTFMINSDGEIFGYVPGKITSAIMEDIITQTINSTKK